MQIAGKARVSGVWPVKANEGKGHLLTLPVESVKNVRQMLSRPSFLSACIGRGYFEAIYLVCTAVTTLLSVVITIFCMYNPLSPRNKYPRKSQIYFTPIFLSYKHSIHHCIEETPE